MSIDWLPEAAMKSAMSRILARTVPKDECLLWSGPVDRQGYGRITVTVAPGFKRKTGIHRVAYMAAYGPVPRGHVLDHLCRTPNCVRPAHLEAVSAGENTRRGARWALPPVLNCGPDHLYSGKCCLPPRAYGVRGARAGVQNNPSE